MKKLFKDLAIGETFHDGKSFGAGANKHIQMWMEYKKISKSQAECINQIGYGNTRGIGGKYPFAPFKTIWTLEA
ncbi:MAG: hypothetical protein WC123_07650 [Bacilli bacterium]